MATAIRDLGKHAQPERPLADPARAIGGPLFDALFFWGAPPLAFLAVWLWIGYALTLPQAVGQGAVALLLAAITVLTFAHLIAVVPRAYFNAEVFAANRRRLTVVPVLVVAALALSPAVLLLGAILAVFWDVHHSAMQTFGLARIYDMKAGNDARALRRTDLVLNWGLYVGPIAAGAALLGHFAKFGELRGIGLDGLTAMPGLLAAHAGPIRLLAVAGWSGALLFAAAAYRVERRRGYRMPAHKAALLASTGAVSIAAWGFSPPFMAFAIVNLFHAVQYFAIVWLKEGGRIRARLPRVAGGRIALPAYFLLCVAFGLAYFTARVFNLLLAPFIACSLLHFWYDSFIWSVRKRQV